MDLLAGTQLGWMRNFEEGRAWLDGLPAAVEACADRWNLDVGAPFGGSNVSLVLAATSPTHGDVVVKIQFPGRESEHEADALLAWGGDGAVRLFDHDRPSLSLLLERCHPGAPLSGVAAGAALDVLVGLLPRLWRPAGAPFTSLADEAARWMANIAESWEQLGRPFSRSIVDRAVGLLADLAPNQGEQVLLHQDLHGLNVLQATREPWLVIDPKPLAGEREFGIAPIVRSPELGHGPRQLRHRFDRLCDELGLDRERARGWTYAQTIAWGFADDGNGIIESHHQVAQWLLDV